MQSIWTRLLLQGAYLMILLQMLVCKSYIDPLSLATLQCAVMAFFIEPNFLEIWKLTSSWEFPCVLYGVSFR
jgi:hypothetical protein